MKIITVAAVEYVAFELAKKHLAFDQPIPDFTTRFPNVLESCVVTPFQKFSGKFLYPSFVPKAAILFYLMIKNHPFQNGNKRIAITTLLTFLFGNKKWLEVDHTTLLNFSLWIAESQSEYKEHVVAIIEQFIKGHLVPLQPNAEARASADSQAT